jgi:hypothetical protein
MAFPETPENCPGPIPEVTLTFSSQLLLLEHRAAVLVAADDRLSLRRVDTWQLLAAAKQEIRVRFGRDDNFLLLGGCGERPLPRRRGLLLAY